MIRILTTSMWIGLYNYPRSRLLCFENKLRSLSNPALTAAENSSPNMYDFRRLGLRTILLVMLMLNLFSTAGRAATWE